MLDKALKESSELQKEVEFLEKKIKDLEKSTIVDELKIEISSLQSELAENKKQAKKNEEKHGNEIKELKKKEMEMSESLRLAVIERENLRESDRILLNTLNMMKIHFDQVQNGTCEKSTLSAKTHVSSLSI